MAPPSSPIAIPRLVVDDYSSGGSPSDGDCRSTPSDSEVGSSYREKADSGVDCSDAPPDEEQVSKVVQQVEYYLSDAVLLKDPFLLKHVRRRKDGFINIKLIASFRKVRTLSKNWRTVAYCLRRSTALQMNEDETRVRRKDPLPQHDETLPSRTVVTYNLPFEKPTVENVSELFSGCGEISLVRILRPGCAAPPDVKRFLQKIPKLGAKVTALVEFEEYEGASKALQMDGGDVDWRALHVVPLTVKTQKGTQECAPETATPRKKRGKKPSSNRKAKDVECSDTDQIPRSRSSDSLSSSPSQCTPPLAPRRWRKPTSDNSPSDGDVCTTPPGGSPWRRRREINSVNRLPPVSNVRLPDGVIRLPRGPDGTRGFCWNGVRHLVAVS